MKLRDWFRKQPSEAAGSEPVETTTTIARLDLDALDACVGGRTETEGVGCYARSTQPRDL